MVEGWSIALLQSSTLDFTITQSEKQALILEAKQIQEHKPKFNIQLVGR